MESHFADTQAECEAKTVNPQFNKLMATEHEDKSTDDLKKDPLACQQQTYITVSSTTHVWPTRFKSLSVFLIVSSSYPVFSQYRLSFRQQTDFCYYNTMSIMCSYDRVSVGTSNILKFKVLNAVQLSV